MIATGNSRNLDLEPLNLAPGTVVHAEVRDPVGPDGIDWVRNPSTNNAATDSGFNGSRFVQTRTWTVGDTTVTASPPAADITSTTANTHPVAGDEVVYVETNHPTDRVLPVTWTLNGTAVPNPTNSRNLDLGTLNLPAGHAHAEGDGHRRRAVGLGRVEDRQRRADRPRHAVRAADHAARHDSSTRSTSTAGTCGSTRRTTAPATRAARRRRPAPPEQGRLVQLLRLPGAADARSRRSSSATPAPTSRR